MTMSQWLIRCCLVIASMLGSMSVFAVEESQEYLLNAGDVLFVSVWQEKDMQQEVLVAPDGSISFPLVGHVQASGKSLLAITNEMKNRLSKYIPDANVTVTLRQTSGNRVFVVGQVNRPGEILMRQPMDVLQVLSSAGGGNAYADLDDIKVIRRDAGKQQVFEFNFKKVAKGEQLEQNRVLKNGDVVIVP
ncbi:MAG TPA: polysaccharide biosynthesis/export family protein [Pseudomonadales bacterium]|nr:polysaccharide biosynthesis/export family protein [Pseudomonadales bacterium]